MSPRQTGCLFLGLLMCLVVSASGLVQTLPSGARFGMAGASSGSLTFFAGGSDHSVVFRSVDVYNTASNTWQSALNLSMPRLALTAASASGLVFFAGGFIDTAVSIASNVVDIWDTNTSQWRSPSQLIFARGALASACAWGVCLFAGGSTDATTPSAAVDLYTISNALWTTAALSLPRYHLAAAAVGSQVLFAGGLLNNSVPSATIDIYDVATSTWSQRALSQPRYYLAGATVGSQVVFAGGSNSTGSAQVDIYDAATSVWSTAALSSARYDLAAAVTGSMLLVAGGFPYSSVVDVYNASAASWSVATLVLPRTNMAAAAAAGAVAFAGGSSTGSQPSASVDIFIVGPSAPSPATQPPPPPSSTAATATPAAPAVGTTPPATSLGPTPAASTLPSTPSPTSFSPPIVNTGQLSLSGHVLVNGTFSQAPQGQLLLQADASPAPLLTVLGCANLSGALTISLNSSSPPPSSLAVLSSPCITGAFDAVTLVSSQTAAVFCGRQAVANTLLSVYTQSCSASSGLSPAIIAGIAAGAAVLLLVVAALVALWLYGWKRPYAAIFGRGAREDHGSIQAGHSPGLYHREANETQGPSREW